MAKRETLVMFLLACTLSLSADQNLPRLYFGGKKLIVGMPKTEALALLSNCCEVGPSANADTVKSAAAHNRTLGRFIFSKDNLPRRILGSIAFRDEKVMRITRSLDADKFDPQSEDVVAFARALAESLSPDGDESGTAVLVTVRQERVSNAGSEILSFSFANGRSIEVDISTLDATSTTTGKRDAVGVDEILEAPGH